MKRLTDPDPFVLRHSVFPILALMPDDKRPGRRYCAPREQGSAFFLSRDGLFLTARHVVSEFSADSYAVMALNLEKRVNKYCRVTALERHPNFDVAVGLAEVPGEEGWPFPYVLGVRRLGIGASVLQYGYANTGVTTFEEDTDERRVAFDYRPRQARMHVEDYLPDGAPLLRGPCYQLSGDLGSGASGSPVVRRRTRAVHAVFCSGSTIDSGEVPSYGFALDVRSFVDDWRIPFLHNRTIREIRDVVVR